MSHKKTSVAAPTPVSDGKYIYALFSCNDLVCLDLDGNLKWLRGLTNDYPNAANSLGMSSSPVIAGGVLVTQVENDADSFAAALDLDEDGIIDDVFGVQGAAGGGGTNGVLDFDRVSDSASILPNSTFLEPPLRIAPIILRVPG